MGSEEGGSCPLGPVTRRMESEAARMGRAFKILCVCGGICIALHEGLWTYLVGYSA